MSVPPEPAVADGVQAQVLIKLGEMATAQAVANTKLDTLLTMGNDHESRIRKLEAWRYGLPLTLLISGGSAAVAIIAYLHR